MDDKKMLNHAIYMVLTNVFKKDVKEFHKIVENAGYTINKMLGHYYVRNEKTRKEIKIVRDGWRSTYCVVYGNKSREIRHDLLCYFDFVKCLDTPINHAYWDMIHGCGNENKIHMYTFKLESAKNNIKYIDDEIEEIKRKMMNLQDKLVDVVTRKEAVYIPRLQKVKDEIRAEAKKSVAK